jgi:hypothetical protein
MDENWTVNRTEEVERSQATWDALATGDPTPALESQAEGIVFDNGPGAGPWRHTEGQAAFLDMMAAFFPLFGESFRQVGKCIFANEQFSITLVAETGAHGESRDPFDNRAIYISRLDADGNTDHVWTVDLDCEDMERFWERNPVER